MAPPRKRTPTREDVLRKLARAGVPVDELEDALAVFFLETEDKALDSARDRRAKAESLKDSIVAYSDAFRAEDSHPNQKSVEYWFRRVLGAAEELIDAARDQFLGELVVLQEGLGIPLQAHDLVDVIRRARHRAKLTYPEIAVLLVDRPPTRRRLRPEHRVSSKESRKDAIARVAASLRKRVSRAAK